MIAKIQNGDDLTTHLSRRVATGYEPSGTPGNYNTRRDLDMMLNDWDVYHLHLSTAPEADGFVERSGPLLFASFRGDDAFLIDVFPHRAWTREAILHILIDEWPDVGFVRELPNVIGLERHTSEQERAALRNAGINASFIERNGKVYAVGSGGITTAGTSARSTMRTNHILRTLKWFADMLDANQDYVSEQLRAHGVQPPETPDLHFAFFPDDTFAVVEMHTNTKFILPGIPHPEPPKAQATA